MAKHSSPDKNKSRLSKREQEKWELLDKLKGLTPEWLQHIAESQRAVMPCSYCSVKIEEKDGTKVITTIAPKYDDLGLCLKCHGRKVVPDQDQRNWAAQELGDRVLPKKQESDITVDDVREAEEIENEIGSLSDEKLKDLIAGFTIKANDNNRQDRN